MRNSIDYSNYSLRFDRNSLIELSTKSKFLYGEIVQCFQHFEIRNRHFWSQNPPKAAPIFFPKNRHNFSPNRHNFRNIWFFSLKTATILAQTATILEISDNTKKFQKFCFFLPAPKIFPATWKSQTATNPPNSHNWKHWKTNKISKLLELWSKIPASWNISSLGKIKK